MNYITVRLTEDQAKELIYQLETLYGQGTTEPAQKGFLMRIVGKLDIALAKAKRV